MRSAHSLLAVIQTLPPSSASCTFLRANSTSFQRFFRRKRLYRFAYQLPKSPPVFCGVPTSVTSREPQLLPSPRQFFNCCFCLPTQALDSVAKMTFSASTPVEPASPYCARSSTSCRRDLRVVTAVAPGTSETLVSKTQFNGDRSKWNNFCLMEWELHLNANAFPGITKHCSDLLSFIIGAGNLSLSGCEIW